MMYRNSTIIGVYALGVICGYIVSLIFFSSSGAKIARPPLSHEELEAIPQDSHTHFAHDESMHNENRAAADYLKKNVRVLCWIMTGASNLWTKAIHVNATWAKRCNKVVFMSDKEDKKFPAIHLNVGQGRDHLTAKTMKAFDYIYKHHRDEADWFLKADDDTFVILENLRFLLAGHSPRDPVYFGHHFKVIVEQGYHSGGAGYVLSREALNRFAKRRAGLCATDHGAEDVEIGRCLQHLGVKPGDSRDALGRTRFHCFDPETHLHGGYPDWYLEYDKYGAKFGMESMSDFPITFHYVSTKVMYDLEFFIYHLRAYGVIEGNPPIQLTYPPKNSEYRFTPRQLKIPRVLIRQEKIKGKNSTKVLLQKVN